MAKSYRQMTKKRTSGIGKIYAVVAWIAVLLMWGSAASVYVSSAVWGKYFSVLGLGYPFGVAAVLWVLAVGLLFRSRWVLIPIAGLLLSIGSLRDYCPINLSSPPPKGCLKVLTYNTQCFGQSFFDDDGKLAVARYLCAEKPDVACLQETVFTNPKVKDSFEEQIARCGLHYATALPHTGPNTIVSRWPIVQQEVVCRSEYNSAVAFYLLRGAGDTLIVVNAHLESMHLSTEERENYHQMVRNPEQAEEIHGKWNLVSKIATAGVKRACLADTLAQYVDQHAGKKLIVMGDFNDTPISYAHHKVCARLTDAYRATGNGIGRSFNRDAIYVRIDNIFCSQHFKPFAARVESSVPFSDHYPMIAYLQETK